METDSLGINKISYLCTKYREMVYKIYGLYDREILRYIGYTKRELDTRLLQHLWATNGKEGQQCHRICWLKSMILRNKEVTIKLLDTSDSFEGILQKEIDWIEQSRLDGADLVNTCTGGKGSSGHQWPQAQFENRCTKVKQYSLKGELIAIHNSLSDAAEVVTGDRKNNSKISQACKGKRGRRSAFKFIWRYLQDSLNKYPIEKQFNVTQTQRTAISKRQTENNVMKGLTGKLHHYSSPVHQLNDNKEIIASFDSMSDVVRELGITSVSSACRKGTKAGGFYWKYQVKI